MEFRLLGSVAMVTEDGDVALGPAKRSSLLAMLLLRPNSAVNVGQLTDALWEEEPPVHAKTVLQGHVSRLRALLAEHGAGAYGVELATQGSAYVLRMPESLVDVHRFEELVGLAGVQRQPADAVRMLREALSYWQGPALTGTVHSRPLEAAATGLEELRLATVEALAQAYGQLGEHARAAAVLRTEAVAHPLRESLAAALMLALGRSGRQSDAIDWYHRTRRLLATVLGEDRIAAEPDAAARLAGLCDGLPLALRVTAARLAERPTWTLGSMVGELADEQSRLTLLDVEDRGVSAALRLTVQQLPDSAARMFRALGLHTGADLDRFAAGALAGTSPAQASADLDRLAAAHLLTEAVPGRWTPHDLVRLYARHLAPRADPEGLPRLLDHYLYTGLAADAAAEPGSQPCYALPADARRPAATREFEDRTAALEWYAAERAALEGAVAAAAALGLHDRAWRLALVQWPLMLMRIGDGWTPLLEAGLASAERVGDADAQSRARALLGWILHAEGRNAEALVHLEKAPGLAARAGDAISEAIAYVNHAAVLDATGEHERAGLLMLHAVSLADRTGHPSTQVLTLQHLAGHCLKAEEYEAALAHTLRAEELVAPDAVVVRAQLQIVRGEALAGIGRLEEATDQLERAIVASEKAGFPEGSARAADRLSRLSADR
ncbi:BTAD domain-containing putative transcriptional regulator [Streptomyces sp. S1]|uniref:AfsR/SARP family transcriptional regulator n=1 Tax=Streptomyces sp. S1 TaxID=718288 RepID=UPI003D7536AB